MKTYTKQEIAYHAGCSTRTINDDCAHLGIVPVKGDRNTNLYSERDFNLISQLREHCKNKNTSRESFVPSTVPEVLNDEVKITRVSNNIIAEGSTIEDRMIHDPFFDLELLQRISDRKWLLPAKRLAPLFGISAKHLNSKSKYSYCGFVATKEMYEQNKALWKIQTLCNQCLESEKPY